MRAIIQRVKASSVQIDGKEEAKIGIGVLILLGVEDSDTQEDIDWLCKKICQLRIFNDVEGVMNLSLLDINGEALVVSQFTLHASTKKGNRPSYIKASKPDIAIPLYESFIKKMENILQKTISTGIFGADMQVFIQNDGPVTISIDTKNKE
ncbi:D-aminoacyl-tRNA deacylase [Aquimarina brevivitae]|uniref:D-aminoacyl-tRNA deacylase n=1 Tax=Aquimarina brevivitae TaxID=323412 RepID=A0A4Q7P0P1_9FLAO|nr:D-aminoacyl-tRNA deacylase [Aquimarina brevivitae]RZS92212.1 D-tyrosyl-tRNA(Tyr) deacylase [Aquimarina brevivitae]